MAQEALPVRGLVSDLYLRHAGRPVLVVGGGPSAPAQLLEVSHLCNPVIVSANGHAVKLGLQPDYIFCKDHQHTETKELMEDVLRPIGAPIVGRHYWMDYRAPFWPVQGNSGMMAIALGVLLGGTPVVPIGFDSYQNGTYFHDLKAPNVSLGRLGSHWRSRYQRLAMRLTGGAVRVLDDTLAAGFPRYTHAETFDRPFMPPALRIYESVRAVPVEALCDFQTRQDPRAVVPAGTRFVMGDAEAAQHIRLGVVRTLIDSEAAPWSHLSANASHP